MDESKEQKGDIEMGLMGDNASNSSSQTNLATTDQLPLLPEEVRDADASHRLSQCSAGEQNLFSSLPTYG